MRQSAPAGDLELRAIAGTHVVLLAWNLDASKQVGLRGFAIKRSVSGSTPTWLKGLKYFKSVVADPVKGAMYPSREQPFQTFLWSDYEAQPNTKYSFTVVALYGDAAAMQERYSATVNIQTEKEDDGTHGVWFNRGVIASHALDVQFQNRVITDAIANQVDRNGLITDTEAKWLSRGLVEACVGFVNGAKAGEGLRVCAYEFTYAVILNALKRALDRGVDVRIVYHFTKKDNDPNLKAIRTANLPDKAQVAGTNQRILFQRTRTQIPHNKFIVKLQNGKPTTVWTGSTNLTTSGFLGQTNVGHLVTDDDTAATYLKYWQELSDDPTLSVAVRNATRLTPNPPNAIQAEPVSKLYSPRIAQNMLFWYAARITDATSLVMMTIPFNVAPEILAGFTKKGSALRLVILENPPTSDVVAAEKANPGTLLFSNGAILGKQFEHHQNQFGGATITPIAHSPLEQWFVDEELARPINAGHVFFVHSKFLVIDPLTDDPLVCSGSANFSKNSLIANDENMLLIRGQKRVADIYLTEFDRIFRHFYARDAINRFAAQGDQQNPLELDETQTWMDPYFRQDSYKNNRRLLFFPDGSQSTVTWSARAAKDNDAFANEADLAKANRQKKSKSARRSGAVKKSTRAKSKASKAKTTKTKNGKKARVVRKPKSKRRAAARKGKSATKKK